MLPGSKLTKLHVALYTTLAVVAVFAVLVLILSTQPVESGCSKTLEMGTDQFIFRTECVDEISNAAKQATLQTGASEEVANAAGEAAAAAARNAFESEAPLSVIAQEIAIETIEVVAKEAAAQGENVTTATTAAKAAGAAAAFATLGAPSPEAAEFAAAAANASKTKTAS